MHDNLKADFIELKHKVENFENTAESMLKNLTAIDTKLSSIADKINKLEILQNHIAYLEKRVESLEKLRWWGGTLLVGAVTLALLKNILK